MDLSIIIVNWNSADYLRKCIDSLLRSTIGIDFEIIVVDNASYDECADMLQTEFPGVIFVQNDRNAGFAKANNLGFRYASGDALLFLNPDTEIIDNSLTVLFLYIQSLPDAGVVGCRLLNSDLSLQASCVQPFPTIINQALDNQHLQKMFPRLRLWGNHALNLNRPGATEVEVIPGACMILRRSVFEQVGRFSDEYFMYTEDIDLCHKSRIAGYKNYYIGEAVVVHHGGGSSAEQQMSHFSEVLMRESLSSFFRKTRGRSGAGAYKATMFLTAIIRIVLLTLAFPWTAFRSPGQKSGAVHSITKWVRILRWSLGLERWAQKVGQQI